MPRVRTQCKHRPPWVSRRQTSDMLCVIVAVCCSVLQCVAVCCSSCASCTPASPPSDLVHYLCNSCSVLQCVAVWCSVLQCVAVRCSALQCVAVHCSVLQCVAVCCSVLQCVAVCMYYTHLRLLHQTSDISCIIPVYTRAHVSINGCTHVQTLPAYIPYICVFLHPTYRQPITTAQCCTLRTYAFCQPTPPTNAISPTLRIDSPMLQPTKLYTLPAYPPCK